MVFALDGYVGQDVALRTVNEVLEYQEIYHLQGLVRVSDERPIEDAIALFGLE